MAKQTKTAAVIAYITEHPGAHAGQIAAATGMPKQLVWAMLNTLKKKGRIAEVDAHDSESNRKVKGYVVSNAGQEGHGAPLAKTGRKPRAANGQATGSEAEVDRWIKAMSLEQAHLVYTRLHRFFGGAAS